MQTQDIKSIVNPINHVRERKRRHYEFLAAFVLFIVVSASSWGLLALYGVNSWVFIALLNVNIIIMLLILFLVGRNTVKLIMERRRKVFGSRLRTRIVLMFILLSLVPSVIMFLASNRVVATGVDYWFTNQTESSLQAALDVGRSFYVAAANRLRLRSELIKKEVDDHHLLADAEAINNLLSRKQKEFALTSLGLVDKNKHTLLLNSHEDFNPVLDEASQYINWENIAKNQFDSILWTTDNADYVIGIYALDSKNSIYLLSAESIGQGLMSKLNRITQGFEEYSKMKQFKNPLKLSFLMILGILCLITIFGAIWLGFRLSKELIAPILALAEGTAKIAKGDLRVHVEDKGLDELALLISSFNKMADDLRLGSEKLTLANELLAKQNETVAERNTYIEAVLDSVATGVITLDSEGKILTVNKAAGLIFKADPKNLEGIIPTKILPSDYASIFANMLTELNKNPNQHWIKQVDLNLGEQSWKLVINAVALQNANGIQAYLAVIEDITELEKMQRISAWREVAKRIAHEIKNPLTPIKLSAERIERKFSATISDPVFTECTHLIVRQVERLQTMVQEFSSFAKLPEINLKKVQIEPLLNEIIALFKNSHGNITWQLELEQKLPEFLLDTEAMHRVLLNICTNATEALEDKKNGIVTISAYKDSVNSCINVDITDNGAGLSKADIENIFEPYYSLKKGGTGLGLPIVKSIISDHKASINVKSTIGTGTTFSLSFPLTEH